MRDESVLHHYYDQIPDDTRILITHSPPLKILDDTHQGGRRVGSWALKNRLPELKNLTHHIFGHIHASYGHTTKDGVNFHNVASLNEDYNYQNAPQIIEVIS
jgi:Icc-related predicted phosphoesterase